MFNKAQPSRPEVDEEGILWYRTQPKDHIRFPRFYSIHHLVAVLRLYRAAREGAIPSGAKIGDVYDYCFFTQDLRNTSSKTSMGHAVVNSVLYEPRVLKNRNRKGLGVSMTYIFRNPMDLTYGLEWQICAPLFHWMQVNKEITKEHTYEDMQQIMQDALDEIATSSEKEYLNLYETPLVSDNILYVMKEPDWRELLVKYPERKVDQHIKESQVFPRKKPMPY